MELNIQLLKGHVPDKVFEKLAFVMQNYGINTPERAAHWLGQCWEESGGFTVLSENLYYTDPAHTAKTFPKYFSSPDATLPYLRNPEKLGNYVYGNRGGNGAPATGDGYKFRGQGPIQITFKGEFASYFHDTGVDVVTHPEWLADLDKEAVRSAGWYWWKAGCNRIADKGVSQEVINEITLVIRGGALGNMPERYAGVDNFYKILTAQAA